MADVTIELLRTHFRQLRLPTIGQSSTVHDAAATNQTFVQFLLGLTEIEWRPADANAVANDQERGVPGVEGLRHLRLQRLAAAFQAQGPGAVTMPID